jgi:1-acyl-sn-glycerol-3-phosphate acyltransferase
VTAVTSRSSETKRPSIFWPLAALIIPPVSLIAKIRVSGAEKLPREGSYVLAPNHYSEFDPLIVAVAVWRSGRAPRFMAKESLFKVPVLGWFLHRTGMIPVARTSSASSARQTMKQSEELVEHGRGRDRLPRGHAHARS